MDVGVKKCKHPLTARQYAGPNTPQTCTIAGKRTIRRRWVKADDPRIALGVTATETILSVARAKMAAP